jgi:regulator of protease activity HflC (stomatin/prohibitin superfamily)
MNFKQQMVAITFGILAVIGLSTLLGSFYTVDSTERGVVTRYGKVTEVATPGLSWKVPFIDTVHIIDIKQSARQYTGVTAYSKDQQTATMTISVNYHVDPTQVDTIYTNFGSIDSLTAKSIDRQIPVQLENVFGQVNAVSAVQARVQLVADLQSAVKNAVSEFPIIIDSVQIENIDFDDAYERVIAARMAAEVEVETRKQNLEMEKIAAKIVVATAQGKADSNLALAKAAAEATTLNGIADAGAIEIKAKALASNAGLVELTKAERWDGKLPVSVTTIPNAAIPFLSK